MMGGRQARAKPQREAGKATSADREAQAAREGGASRRKKTGVLMMSSVKCGGAIGTGRGEVAIVARQSVSFCGRVHTLERGVLESLNRARGTSRETAEERVVWTR